MRAASHSPKRGSRPPFHLQEHPRVLPVAPRPPGDAAAPVCPQQAGEGGQHNPAWARGLPEEPAPAREGRDAAAEETHSHPASLSSTTSIQPAEVVLFGNAARQHARAGATNSRSLHTPENHLAKKAVKKKPSSGCTVRPRIPQLGSVRFSGAASASALRAVHPGRLLTACGKPRSHSLLPTVPTGRGSNCLNSRDFLAGQLDPWEKSSFPLSWDSSQVPCSNQETLTRKIIYIFASDKIGQKSLKSRCRYGEHARKRPPPLVPVTGHTCWRTHGTTWWPQR